MASRNQNRLNSFEPKHWQERTEDDSDDTDDASDDMNGSADDFEEPEDGQVSSQTSDDDLSTDENLENDSDTSYSEDENNSNEKYTTFTSKIQEQASMVEVKTFETRSGRQWNTVEPSKYKIPSANILRQRHGIGRSAAEIQTIAEAFQLMIIHEMILLIVSETNRRACFNMKQWNDQNPGKEQIWKDTDGDEIWAFIGLLILAGVHRSKNENLNELWSMVNGQPIFRATMTETRFKALLRFCRFDNVQTRNERVSEDKLAPIRDLWTMFLARLRVCYIPGGSLTVDEQLVPTRGRCSFRQYMPAKSGKYGLKIFWCCDSSTAYPLAGEVYLGRQSEATTQVGNANRINNLLKRLVQPWMNTGRTITTDNYFTNAELAEDLLGAQTTLVGTVRRNKREIPKELQPNRWRPEHSSIFCFDRQLTVVSCVPKKGRAVILLSSMHHEKVVDQEQKKKPEIILYYNDTKGGVDRMNQMIATYSCRRKIKRWPMTFFFNMIDVAGIAAFIVWVTRNTQWNIGKTHRRRLFLLQLGHDLVRNHLDRRRQQPQAMQRDVRLAMQAIGVPLITSSSDAGSVIGVRQRCRLCSRERDRKVITRCASCHSSCCPDHYKVICDTCYEIFSE